MAVKRTKGDFKCTDCKDDMSDYPTHLLKKSDHVIRCQKCWRKSQNPKEETSEKKAEALEKNGAKQENPAPDKEKKGKPKEIVLVVEHQACAGTFSALVTVLRNNQPVPNVTVYYAVSASSIAWKTKAAGDDGVAKISIRYVGREREVCFVFPGADSVTVPIPVKPGTEPDEDELPVFSKAVRISADVVQGTEAANIYVCTTDAEGNPVPAPIVCTMSGVSRLKPFVTSDGIDSDDHLGTALIKHEGCERPRMARLYIVGADSEQGMTEIEIPARIRNLQQVKIPPNAAIMVDADVFDVNEDGKIQVQVQTYYVVDGDEIQEACFIGYQTDDIPLTVTHTSDGILRNGDEMDETYRPKGMTVIDLDKIPSKPTKMSIHVYGKKADVKELDLPYIEPTYERLPIVEGAGFWKNFAASLKHGWQTR